MKPKVLYLSYNGMMEALGASQVLSYVHTLAEHYEYHLISLEKPGDLKDEDRLERMRRYNAKNGIKWSLLLYGESKIGKLHNFFRFTWEAYRILKREKIQFVHCRSYVTAAAVFFIGKILPVKYLFDTRNFSFDERADIGSLNRDGWLYKLGKRFEKHLYEQASGIVILARKGKETILNDELFSGGRHIRDIEVIPTCVDLDRFVLHQRDYTKEVINIGYVGTAVGWYDFEKTAATLKVIAKYCTIHFVVFNSNQYGQHEYIRKMLKKYAIPEERCTIERVAFEEMPSRLKEIDISLFYIHPYFSKRASAATKLGELLASGIPVLTNGGVGDHEYYVKTYKVGAILDFDRLDDYPFDEIIPNLLNQETARRCRMVAEKYFSLREGAKVYHEIYQRVLIN